MPPTGATGDLSSWEGDSAEEVKVFFVFPSYTCYDVSCFELVSGAGIRSNIPRSTLDGDK